MANVVGVENVRLGELMKNHTSFKVGGPADIMVTPSNETEVALALKICKAEGIPVFIMGNGTNLLVRDKGIRGVVIKTFDNFKGYAVKDNIIEAKTGTLLYQIANAALEHELEGFEFASGIPGTLGGAVAMNAGAYGREMKDVIIKTRYIDENGGIRTILGDQHQFGYRTSFIQKAGGIALESEICLRKGKAEEIKARMDDLRLRRREKQPLEMPSAGSMFKRPEGYFAGKLIEDCGLKGLKIGGAQVSEKHCGFVVNAGDATADDILKLIERIQREVMLKFGVELHTEVKVVGEE